LDGKSGDVTVEPGINYGKLQQTLQTHGRFLPPYPASVEYSTVGGAVAKNASGEKSLKYGDTRLYVKGLRVVLANGEAIETRRLSKREFSKKLGLATFEGEIYRAVDTLLEEQREVLNKLELNVTKNSAGYHLTDIKHKDGSFDLTPLFVGSEGTLGIITSIMFETESYNPETSLIIASFDTLEHAQAAIMELRKLSELPSAIEMVDSHLLDLVDSINPNLLKNVWPKPFPPVTLLIEFDNQTDRQQKKYVKKAEKILSKTALSYQVELDPLKQEELWKIRQASSMAIAHVEGNLKAVPVIEDGVVPVDRLQDYLMGIYSLFNQNHLKVAVWGHAGDANLHLQPYLNLGQVGDRQKAFRLMDEYYRLVISLGGSTSGENGDGRLRAPYLEQVYGSEAYVLFQKIKQILDPYNTLNPGVKINVSLDDIKPLLRQEYSLEHLYDHMPRS
jgi:FAD/FMN-containing dehydrogenase